MIGRIWETEPRPGRTNLFGDRAQDYVGNRRSLSCRQAGFAFRDLDRRPTTVQDSPSFVHAESSRLVLGAIGFGRIALWSAFSDIYGPHWALVGLTVGLSLVGIVLWGCVAGAMLPFALKRLGLDPATSSAPFVATLVDVTGLVIYFSVAIVVLRGTML